MLATSYPGSKDIASMLLQNFECPPQGKRLRALTTLLVLKAYHLTCASGHVKYPWRQPHPQKKSCFREEYTMLGCPR